MVPLFLEWERIELAEGLVIGIMVELESGSKGEGGVWDAAAGWTWGSVKIFRPDPP